MTTDWFFFVYNFISLLVGITFYSLECAFVPIWPGLSTEKRNDLLYSCLMIGCISLFLFEIAGICFSFFVPQFFGFINPFNTGKTTLFSVLLFLQPTLAYFAALFSSLFQSDGHYFWPITHLTLRSVGVLVVLLLPVCSGVFCLAIAYTVGEFLRSVVLCVNGLKNYPLTSLDRKFHIRPFRNYFIAIGWMALMICASILNTYVDFIMVGHLGPGLATLVEYGGRLRGLPILALSGVLVIFLGDWSRTRGEKLTWQEMLKGTLKTVLCAATIAITLFYSREYWIPLIFRGYKFDSNQLDVINHLMAWYLIGSPFLMAIATLSRGFLVWRYFRVLAIMSLISIGINFFLNLMFIKIFGVTGVAMSTTGLDVIMLCGLLYWGGVISKRRVADWPFVSGQ